MSDTPVLDSRTAKILPWVIAIAFFMQMLDGTALNIVLPSMAVDLQTTPIHMQSVVISYALTLAFLIPASGWIADRFGMKRVFMFAMALFTASSVACGLAQSLPMLVLFRIAQATGGALMVPVGRLIALKAYPREQVVDILSFITMPGLVGPMVGPTLGGIMVEYLSWHWIFLINLPVGILGLIATMRYMPTFLSTEGSKTFDIYGFLLCGIFMLSTTIGLEGIGEFHFPISVTSALIFLGIASLILYFIYATRKSAPIFSINIFHVHNFRIGLLGNILTRLGNGAMPFLTPLLLQIGLGYSPMEAGMAMIPMTVGAIIAKRFVTRLVHRFGFKPVLILNTMILGIMIASYSLITPSMNPWTMLAIFAIFGLINSTQFTAMNTVTLVDLSDTQVSSGNSIFAAIQQLSMGMGVAVAASLLDLFSESSTLQIPKEAVSALSATYICLGAIAFVSTVIFIRLRKSTVK